MLVIGVILLLIGFGVSVGYGATPPESNIADRVCAVLTSIGVTLVVLSVVFPILDKGL
jgi:fumarate reductase subunit D